MSDIKRRQGKVALIIVLLPFIIGAVFFYTPLWVSVVVGSALFLLLIGTSIVFGELIQEERERCK